MFALNDSTPMTVLALGDASNRALAWRTGELLVQLSIENHSGPIWWTPSDKRNENPPEPDASENVLLFYQNYVNRSIYC